MNVKNYLAKFDANGNRGSTIPIDGTISDDEIKSYESQGYVIISAEDWGYYVGAHGTGDNGTGYIRDVITGKPISAPSAPVVEATEEPTANVPETELAVMEGMVDMQSRIAALEAELAKLKEGK